jgi:hypothetical protein
MEEKSEYLTSITKQMMEATGVPSCFVCGKRIIGMHLDYIDHDRNPRKVCIGCTFIALDFYLSERQKRMNPEAHKYEK